MKILKAKCQYCGKEITSIYQKQLDYNLKAHELSCKENKDFLKNEGLL
jgi:hypothetical protein